MQPFIPNADTIPVAWGWFQFLLLLTFPLHLLAMNALLVEEGFRGHGRQQETHSIRLEPECHFQGVVGDHLEIDRLVVPRSSVQGAAGCLDLLKELILTHVL